MNEWLSLWRELWPVIEQAMIETSDNVFDRQRMRRSAQRRAAAVVEELRQDSKRVVRELTLSAIDGNANAAQLKQRVMDSPIFSFANARRLAAREYDRLQPKRKADEWVY